MSRITLYPLRNAPLVPAVLMPFIGDQAVKRTIVRRYGLPRGLRLVDLGERVWTEFPPQSIDALAAEVVSATTLAQSELATSKRKVRIDPSGEGLSARARNALIRAGLLGSLGLTPFR